MLKERFNSVDRQHADEVLANVGRGLAINHRTTIQHGQICPIKRLVRSGRDNNLVGHKASIERVEERAHVISNSVTNEGDLFC